jgi:hypothetical protein
MLLRSERERAGYGLKFGAKLSTFENRYQQANQEFRQRQKLWQYSALKKINHQDTKTRT